MSSLKQEELSCTSFQEQFILFTDFFYISEITMRYIDR